MSGSERAKLFRNFCIMAHVDHGKTTLADFLISHSGTNCKGTRYMDSREDESEKGRTMKCSCVTLSYNRKDTTYLLNLIDSPGHVDFSSEVSTAVRLCDGALIVVDVMDGVCPQTKTVLKQAIFEELKPILVMNKIDKLILTMTPYEVYKRLQIVLEQVNAVMGEIHNTDVFLRSSELANDKTKLLERAPKFEKSIDLNDWRIEDVDDTDIYFRPEVGNVIIGSAFDGWGFRLDTFAKKFCAKFNMSAKQLRPYLWGDYYVSTKGGKTNILPGAREKGKTPLFVTLILNNICQVYEAIVIKQDEEETARIVTSLSIELPFYLQQARTAKDIRQRLSYIMDKWLPLGSTVSEAIADLLPSPMTMSVRKATKLMCPDRSSFDSLPHQSQLLRESFMACLPNGDDVPLIVFVSKMISVEVAYLTHLTANGTPGITINGSATTTGQEVLLGFARVFSGTLSVGQKVYVLSPKHDPRDIASICDEKGQITEEDLANLKHITTCEITSLYILDVRNFTAIKRAFAGMMVGIGGLSDAVLKSGTLSSTAFCPAFTELTMYSKPIFRVAVEPKCVTDLPQFRAGLEQLNKADKCVEIELDSHGQYVLVTGGEVHLERCMTDLITTYAGVPIKHSEPIVPFRETIVPSTATTKDKPEIETTLGSFHDAKVTYTLAVEAVPLPPAVTTLLDDNKRLLLTMNKLNATASTISDQVASFRCRLAQAFTAAGSNWHGAIDTVWSFGPNYCGANILFNGTDHAQKPSVWHPHAILEDTDEDYFYANFVAGFQTAAMAGTLFGEPMLGVGFVVRQWAITGQCNGAAISGQVISVAKDGCLRAFSVAERRIMMAMYSCVIDVDETVVGKTYSLIAKRNGRIVDGDVIEGSSSWNVTAYLPIVESMKFSDELRTITSGAAFPQLVFSHFETLDEDPFWKPETEEELEQFGATAGKEILAHKYLNSVRRRKGLATDEMLVDSPEKQRTRSKK